MRRLLVTGAAGRIGRSFVEAHGGRYGLRLGVHHPGRLPQAPPKHERVRLEIGDLESCRAACRGMDTVLHLAANPSPKAAFEALLDSNIRGAYNVFRAAADEGCRRVVFASSGRAVRGYPPDVEVRPEMPVRPADLYGAAKCWGEAVAHCFAHAERLSCICVRIGAFLPKGRSLWNHDPALMSRVLTARDCDQLLRRCIEAEGIQFAIVHGVSNNRFKAMDITSARELLGYEPMDDAWALRDGERAAP